MWENEMLKIDIEPKTQITRHAPTSKNAQDLTAALSYYIAKDMMPFQIIEAWLSEAGGGCRASLQSTTKQTFLIK